MPKILVLDGNSLANRAFYALPVLTTPDGRPTNVLHGFMTMLLRLQQEENPDYWVVTFDKTKPTVRMEQFSGYKAQRKETPEGLRPQFDFLKEVLAGFSVPMIELAGYEADDLIARVALKAEERGWETQVYTGDKDALQLISPRTRVFLTKKGISEVECYDEHLLWERYRLRPKQIIDLKGLMGDSSDNIPGVPGVGEKTALKLLWEYGSVEEVLAHSQDISGKKLQSSLQEYADQALLSKQLATMCPDAPLDFSLDDFIFRLPQNETVLKICENYHLRSIKRIWQERHALAETKMDSPVNGQNIQMGLFDELPLGEGEINPCQAIDLTESEWPAVFQQWQSQRQELMITFHYLGPNPHQGKLQRWGIADETTVYELEQIEGSRQTEAWLQLLADPAVPKKVVDNKTLTALLLSQGRELKGVVFDMSLAAYLINPARTKYTSLDLVREYYPSQEPFTGIGQEASALKQAVGRYENDLERFNLTGLLKHIELPLSSILAGMESHGVGIDIEKLKEFGQELHIALFALEKEIYADTAQQFNLNSPQQLGVILFEKLGLPPKKKTKTGYSTDAETLEELKAEHPVIEKILEYRQLNKLMSTYVNGLLAQERNQRIHTTFQQTVTATGRLSSTEPNLQNIPIRLAYGRQLRKVFRPTEKDWLLLSADYSQIELRILAHYAQDELLMDSFRQHQDVHNRTAAEVFGVPLAEVTSDMRRKAKAVNFGLMYGLTDFGLARDLGIPRKEAKYYIEQYFSRYSGVKRYLTDTIVKAKAEGQVRTLLNRLRRIPELYSANRTQRQFGERIAMNTPIQGTAADIMKLAMVDVAEGLSNHRAVLLLQVHDELLIQVPEEELDSVAVMLKEKMENAIVLSVPLTVECKIGPNWYEMQAYPGQS